MTTPIVHHPGEGRAPSGSLRGTAGSQGTPGPVPTAPDGVGAGLDKAARQFEAVFLRQMIASMRTATPRDTLFGSDATNQFRDMADARLADAMAGRFGIAAMVERQLGK